MAKTEANVITAIRKEQKGKMILLYAVVDGTEQHFSSFFHDWKADLVMESLGFPAKGPWSKGAAKKEAPAAKSTIKKIGKKK